MDDWLSEQITYIKGLNNPTDRQKFIVLMAENPDPSEQDLKNLNIAIREEKAAIRAFRIQWQKTHELNLAHRKAQEQFRKERTRRLIMMGTSFILARFEDRSNAELLGFLLLVEKDRIDWERCKRMGEEKLSKVS